MNQLTDAEYVAKRGAVCPFCGSQNIEGQDRVEVCEDGCTQDVSCAECDRAWTDSYVLVGYMEEPE